MTTPKHLPYAKFFLAESMFSVLKEEGHNSNFLDIEKDLSAFSDFVIVVLESESAFCELGAFATYEELRKKLIIINDSNHRESTSYINLGPIKAVHEISEGRHILYYKMEDNGKFFGDGIGEVFKNLHSIIHKEPKLRRSRAMNFNPNESFSKDSFRFIHDIVYMATPISFIELSRVIKEIFSQSKDKQLNKHLALLSATEQIKRKASSLYPAGLYYSMSTKPYFEYGFYDISSLIASFKNLYFRYDKMRLHESC